MAPLDETNASQQDGADTETPNEWYSKKVWGTRQNDDDTLFEVMCLQVFQAGLTWRMIIERRDAFRRVFHGWSIARVADLGPEGVDEALQDATIIRNRRKVEACVANARVVRGLQGAHGSFCRWFYDVLEGDELAGLQRDLRKTFKFMGPEIARMWLLASGRIGPEG
jgi:DNA-3-methyladenine glycosylase I